MNRSQLLDLLEYLGITAVIAVLAFSIAACSYSGKRLSSLKELQVYLSSQPNNSPDNPIKVSINAKDLDLKAIAETINIYGKYLSLDLSGNPITTIPGNVFYNCKYLTGVIMPNSVTSIGAWAFYGCTSLASITIPDIVTTIGNSAFSGCSGLTSITIPNSVTSIGAYAFDGCTSLTSVTFQGTIAESAISATIPFLGDLRAKYLAAEGGTGIYTTTAPVSASSVWTKTE